MPVYIEPDSEGTQYALSRSETMQTLSAGTRAAQTAICWPDDTLVTGESVVEVALLGDAGYRVDPGMNRGTITITEDDDCANPGAHTLDMPIGGNLNTTCVCRTRAVAAELYPGLVQLANGNPWDHTVDDYYVTINGNRALRSSTDSSNSCPESPDQGPGS